MHANRREFLSGVLGSSAVLSLSGAAPGFLLEAAEQGAGKKNEKILVVVQLSGGNDGLNTVVPFGDDAYYRNRKKLAVQKNEVLKIDDYSGFHPNMQGFADLLEAGQLSVVHGVGYDNPNRSHFESMDIWHTCRRKTEIRGDGWLGRFLESAMKGKSADVPAVHLGEEKQPLALAAPTVRTPSIRSLDRFKLKTAGKEKAMTIREITSAKRTQSDDLLNFVQSSTSAALSASDRVEKAARDYKTDITYPGTGLARKLKTVAQLIDSGLSTRVYYVTLDGFDTHSQQAAAHAGLLEQVSGAIAAFTQDIVKHHHGDRVMLMAFSEFGRRVKENASDGTDHGAAAPLFFAGKNVKSGLIGKHPSLTDLSDGDLKHHTDFRQCYAAVLDNWLGWSSKDILDRQYTPVDVIRT